MTACPDWPSPRTEYLHELVQVLERADAERVGEWLALAILEAGRFEYAGWWVTSHDRAWILPDREAEAAAWLRERGVRPRKGKFKSRELGWALRRLGVDIANDPVL